MLSSCYCAIFITIFDTHSFTNLFMNKSDIKILLVDDEPDILEIVGYNLKNEGYQIFTASNGQEAIKSAKKNIKDEFSELKEDIIVPFDNNLSDASLDDNAKWVKKIRDKELFSLNYNDYRASLDLSEKEAKRFEELSEYQTNLTFESLSQELKLMEQDSVLKEKRERWHKNLSKDVYIEESLMIMKDMLKGGTNYAGSERKMKEMKN